MHWPVDDRRTRGTGQKKKQQGKNIFETCKLQKKTMGRKKAKKANAQHSHYMACALSSRDPQTAVWARKIRTVRKKRKNYSSELPQI